MPLKKGISLIYLPKENILLWKKLWKEYPIKEWIEIFQEKLKKIPYPTKWIEEEPFLEKNPYKELSIGKKIKEELEKYDFLILFPSLYPFFDLEKLEELIKIHIKYEPQISFVENAPPGLSSWILSKDLLQDLEVSSFKDFSSLEEFIRKHLEKFYVEIDFWEPDLRIYRLDFSLNKERSLYESRNFFHKLSSSQMLSPYSYIEKVLKSSPEILFSFPSWLEIEISSSCLYACIFCPRQYVHIEEAYISWEHIRNIQRFLENSLGDTTLCLGGWGEPLEHPDIEDILTFFLKNPHVPRIFLESNGYFLEKIFPLLEKEELLEKLYLIININSLKHYLYIHQVPSSFYKKVRENLQKLSKIAPPSWKKQVYLQALKLKENEYEIDSLFHFAEEELGFSFLLQKYNSYINYLPDRKLADLSPLDRFFCWHLRRDLFIRANGDVLFCKQDIFQKKIRGNLLKTPLKEIWERQKEDWIKNFYGKYPKYPNCTSCDEYYTFNF